ncbi:g4509 [Coccomyxa elongata]
MPDIPFTAPAPPLFTKITEAPGNCTRSNKKGRLVVARYWTVGALLLFFVPAFAFLTFEIFLQASGLRKETASGSHASLRVSHGQHTGHTSLTAVEEIDYPHFPSASHRSATLENATTPVIVSVMTPQQFVSGFNGSIPGCEWQGQSLGCHYVVPRNDPRLHMRSDAVFYHGPNLCLEYHNNGTRVVKSTRRQLAVLMTMESAAYYPCFDDPVFMGPFDLEISYRREAQLPISYLRKDHVEGWRHDALVPFEERSDSPVYVQSNCMPQVKRDNIVRNLMKFPDLNIRSFGRCLNTEGLVNGTKEDKVDIYRRHKICIVMENSIATDYVTEKLYDAFVAGCVPLYYGAPNIEDLLPDPDSIIDYRVLGSTAAVRKEILRVMGNKEVWESKVAWRKKRLGQLSPAFQAQVLALAQPSVQCQLCSLLADNRAGNMTLVQQFHDSWEYRSDEEKRLESRQQIVSSFFGYH